MEGLRLASVAMQLGCEAEHAKDTGNKQGNKDLHEVGFTENPKLAVPKEEPHCGLQCLYLWSEGERARQLFLASSLHMKWRRDSLIARDTERQLTTEERARCTYTSCSSSTVLVLHFYNTICQNTQILHLIVKTCFSPFYCTT